MTKNKIVCLIPARSGSTRIYNKNIIKINNKSLISYALNSAIKSKLVEKVYVSTNTKKIRNVVRKFSSKKIIITSRSKKSETQHAKTELLLNEFCNRFEFDILVLLQLTNIFISSKILNMAINKFIEPFNYNPLKRPRTQDLKNFFLENGSFYIFTRKGYFNYKNRIHGKTAYFEMPKKSYFDIDTLEDLKIVRKLVK